MPRSNRIQQIRNIVSASNDDRLKILTKTHAFERIEQHKGI